ncbi:MAG: hypothetical protein CMI13_12670 [Oleibacter sp.]|nr:hypothetical protein [Thalassolituus sp.]|tara:strand:+ start:267 stop:551 length:285 start_codon:yes stop_codon:yes gene_type:complete
MEFFISNLIAFSIVPIVIYLVALTMRVLRTSSQDFERLRKTSGGVRKVLMGAVDTQKSSVRDHYVHAGLVFDKSNGKLMKQGTLSDEALEVTLR